MASNNLIFILCVIGIVSFIVYYVFLRKPNRGSYMQTSQIRRNRQALGNDQCCICLSQQKKFQVSITCGHSFCGKCLLGLHDHSNQKIKCPLCRDDVNVIFRVFKENEQPREQGLKIRQKIRQYNQKFEDNRSFSRRLSEFPFVLRAASDRIFTLDFIRFFLSTANLVKMGITIIIYLASPIDLLPQMLLGFAGYVDDFGFLVIVILYTVANSTVEYVRRRQ